MHTVKTLISFLKLSDTQIRHTLKLNKQKKNCIPCSMETDKLSKINRENKVCVSTIEEGENLSLPGYHKGLYSNPDIWGKWKDIGIPGTMKFIMSSLFKRPKMPSSQELDEHLEVVEPDMEAINNPDPNKIQLTWIGHSSFLIQLDGFNFLTDPVFSDRCSPSSFLGPKRFRPLPLQLEDLPRIDFVVLSHNHYDHLDIKAVKYLQNSALWCIPKDLGTWFTKHGVDNFIEFNWWEKCVLHKSISVVFLPAQHWSKRNLIDNNQTLWGGFAILGKRKKIYFAGDTGYNEILFKEIGNKLGPFDVSLIPIGAYNPRDFLAPQHIGPAEAVIIHKELKSKKSIGIHWGTFVLSNEHVFDPPREIELELEKHELEKDSFIVVKHGEMNKFENRKKHKDEEAEDD